MNQAELVSIFIGVQVARRAKQRGLTEAQAAIAGLATSDVWMVFAECVNAESNPFEAVDLYFQAEELL